MYKGPILDTHMHLWDLANDRAWLSQDSPAMRQLFGNYDALQRNFLAPDYIEPSRGWNITRSVHVQAMGFPGWPVAETEWLQQQADAHGFIALADLADPQLDTALQQHARQPKLCGLRMPLYHAPQAWRNMAAREDHMRDAAWRRGFALLARDFANTRIVVEHLAWPIGDLHAGFGAQRCLFGSNCPPDTEFHLVDALMEMSTEAFSRLPGDELQQLLFGTAQRVYRL